MAINIPDRKNTKCLKWDLMEFIGGSPKDIPMWIADMDYAVEPEVLSSIRKRLEHPVLGYSFQLPDYKAALNSWYTRRHGTHFEDDMFLPCLNVLGSMQLILNHYIKSGDQVMMFTPVYPQFYGVIQTAGAQLAEYPVNCCEDIDWCRAEELIARSKAVLFCNPHNPLARVWTEEECRTIARICEKNNVLMLSDEVHGDMAMFGHRYFSMASFEEIGNHTVVFTSAAKTFNLAGLGGAALIIPDAGLRKEIQKQLESYYQCEIPVLSAEGIRAAYTYGDQWLDETKAYLEENVTAVLDRIEKDMPKLKCTHQGTFLMWIDWRGLGRDDLDIADLMKKEVHILLDNGIRYGTAGKGFIRANIACSRDLLFKALDGFCRLYSDIEDGKY